MSKPKGAPPPGWRPTVKGKSGFSGQGDVLTNAAQGGSVLLPDGGAPISGSRFSGTAGAQGGQRAGGGQANSDLRELFGADLPDYGQYRAVPIATGDSRPASGARGEAAGQRPGSGAGRSAHSRFFEDDEADAKAPAPAPRAKGAGFDALFEGLDDGNDSKPKPGSAAGAGGRKPAARPDLPDHYPTGHNGPDYRGLFERLQGGGAAKAPAQEAPLFKQTEAVEEPPPSAQPSLPRATMGSGKSIKKGQKLVLDLDSFLVDCAVDWGRERLVKSFHLCGKADEGVTKWSELMQSRGVLTVDDFRNHGVELDLSDSAVIAMDYQQLEKFQGALKMERSLTTLRLTRAQLGDTGCSWLAGGMMKNRSLKELIISENGISDTGVDGLAAVLDTNTTLTSLDISSNNLTSSGASLLADGLKRNRKLRELNLSFNAVDDAGAENLAEAVDPEGASTSVLRTLNLEGNPIGRSGCTKLLDTFRKKGTFLETLYLPDETHSTKTEPEGRKKKEPEKFIVVCSETGVDIRAAGRRAEQVTWQQEAEDIEINFKEDWIQKMDMKTASIDFSEQHLRIEIKGVTMMDAKLYGPIRPRDCSWTMGNGILQVILAKADKSDWASLTVLA